LRQTSAYNIFGDRTRFFLEKVRENNIWNQIFTNDVADGYNSILLAEAIESGKPIDYSLFEIQELCCERVLHNLLCEVNAFSDEFILVNFSDKRGLSFGKLTRFLYRHILLTDNDDVNDSLFLTNLIHNSSITKNFSASQQKRWLEFWISNEHFSAVEHVLEKNIFRSFTVNPTFESRHIPFCHLHIKMLKEVRKRGININYVNPLDILSSSSETEVIDNLDEVVSLINSSEQPLHVGPFKVSSIAEAVVDDIENMTPLQWDDIIRHLDITHWSLENQREFGYHFFLNVVPKFVALSDKSVVVERINQLLSINGIIQGINESLRQKDKYRHERSKLLACHTLIRLCLNNLRDEETCKSFLTNLFLDIQAIHVLITPASRKSIILSAFFLYHCKNPIVQKVRFEIVDKSTQRFSKPEKGIRFMLDKFSTAYDHDIMKVKLDSFFATFLTLTDDSWAAMVNRASFDIIGEFYPFITEVNPLELLGNPYLTSHGKFQVAEYLHNHL